MLRYRTNDNETFSAASAADLVAQMRKASFVPSKNDEEFMIEVAKRAKLLKHDARIPTNSAVAFVRGLVQIGFLQVDHG